MLASCSVVNILQTGKYIEVYGITDIVVLLLDMAVEVFLNQPLFFK